MNCDASIQKTSYSNKFKCIMICLLPLLIYYQSIFGLFSEITTPIILILDVNAIIQGANDKKGFTINSRVFCVICYFIIATFVGYILYNGDASTLHSLVVAISVIVILERNSIWIRKNASFLIRAYLFITWIVVVAFFTQFMVYHILGSTLVFRFPFLRIINAYGDVASLGTVIYSYATGFSQFSGFFSEKAHLATYVLPAILLYINGTAYKKRNFLLATILSLSVLLTTSGTGVIGVVLVWLLSFVSDKSKTFSFRNVAIILLAVFLVLMHFFLVSYSDSYANSIGALFSTSGIKNTKTSIRVFRGLEIYGDLPILNKIFGIGFRMYSHFSRTTGFSSIYDNNLYNIDYFSAFSQVLLYFGFIGFILFGMCIFLFLHGNFIKRNLLILYIVLSFGLSILFDMTFFLYFTLIIAVSQDLVEKEIQI